MGAVGRREFEKEGKQVAELTVADEHSITVEPLSGSAVSAPVLTQTDIASHANSEGSSSDVLQDALRSEAYSWPRLIFPPLKKSGHIILDSCTAEGPPQTYVNDVNS